ncbi:hypothetical protein GCM10011319_02000 [Mameliella alba]|nr:hypothetical protein GCM10011319_02000 [Mameliella alba]
MVASGSVRPGRGSKREVSIWHLLVWAFRDEKVSLDFDELASVSGERPGIGTEWLLMQRKDLGCQIDGGGRSEPHPDADLVASAVAALPEGCGGRRMGIWIAELARADRWPVPPEVDPVCEPVTWRRCKHGMRARRELLVPGLGGDMGYWCPVRFTGDARATAAQRRSWLAWWGALLELQTTFRTRRDLTGFVVDERMPPQQPWRKGLTEKSLC